MRFIDFLRETRQDIEAAHHDPRDVFVGDKVRTRKSGVVGTVEKVVPNHPTHSWTADAVFFRTDDGKRMVTPLYNVIVIGDSTLGSAGLPMKEAENYRVIRKGAPTKPVMLHHVGFTEITYKDSNVTIYHGGNMGNTVENSVKPNVDKMLGRGAFDFLEQHGKIYKDKAGNVHDAPSYSYVLNVPREYYTAWLDLMKKRVPTKHPKDDAYVGHDGYKATAPRRTGM